MSERRTILSRPRTKVYESNYNIGESYYKPMVDHLDRKYSGRPLFPSPPREIRSPRRALDEEFLRDSAFDRPSSHFKDSSSDFFDRASNVQKEADAFFDRHGRRTEADRFLDRPSSHHHKSESQDFFDKQVSKAEESFAEKSQSLRNKADQFVEKARESSASFKATDLDDEIDDQISAQMKRIKASRAAASVAADDDLEFALNGIKPNAHILRYKFGFHDKVLDAFGVDGRYQEHLIEDIIRRRQEPQLEFPEETLPSFPIVGKWSKLNGLSEEEKTAIGSSSDSIAQLKARHDQIRVTNIKAELAAIEEKSEARAKRLAEIKNILATNDALSSLSHAVHEKNVLSSVSHGLHEKKILSSLSHEKNSSLSNQSHYSLLDRNSSALQLKSIAF